jgi:nucleoside-diphosphate-sugar epimerase
LREEKNVASILVTGGAGFIGSNISEALLALGHRVIVLDDLSTGRRENIDHLVRHCGLHFIHGTILDAALLRTIINEYDIDLISHQAAIPSVAKSFS